MIGIWLIFSLYIIIHYILMKNYGDLFRLVVRFLIGVFVFILPLFVYLLSKGIFFEMLYQSIGINFIYTTESNSGSIKEILKWYISESNLLTLNVIIFISSLLSWEKYKSKSILYHIVFLLCLMLALVSKRSYGHYILVVIPLLIPYLASIFNLMKNVTISKVLFLSLGLSVVYLSNINAVKESIRTRDRNSSYLQQTVANYIKSNTEFNDRIYTHRQNGTIYLYSDRLSSTKYFFIPAVTNDQILIEDFKKSIIENPPKYIVFDTEWDYGKRTDSFVKQYIHDNYKLEKQVETSMIYRKIGS
ncbi:putative membrane protein [Streptococcus mitis]|nr:putative membrane protein [Streptococcus mitis]